MSDLESERNVVGSVSVTKSLFHSKIFWVNIIALVCLFLQLKFGWVIDESAQMQILAVVNIILRYFTKEGVYIR